MHKNAVVVQLAEDGAELVAIGTPDSEAEHGHRCGPQPALCSTLPGALVSAQVPGSDADSSCVESRNLNTMIPGALKPCIIWMGAEEIELKD